MILRQETSHIHKLQSRGGKQYLAFRACAPQRWLTRPNIWEKGTSHPSMPTHIPWLTWWQPRSLSTDPSYLGSFPPPWCTRGGEATACARCLWLLEPSRGSLTQMLWPVRWTLNKRQEEQVLSRLLERHKWFDSMPCWRSPIYRPEASQATCSVIPSWSHRDQPYWEWKEPPALSHQGHQPWAVSGAKSRCCDAGSLKLVSPIGWLLFYLSAKDRPFCFVSFCFKFVYNVYKYKYLSDKNNYLYLYISDKIKQKKPQHRIKYL